VQEVQQVVGILPGRIEADVESDGGMSLGDGFQALAQLGIPLGRLGEQQFVGGGLQVVVEEAGIVPVARGIDADAEAARRL
jgi:hypothetical protein